MSRPDLSDYVAHFTKNSVPFAEKPDYKGIGNLNAIGRMISILESHTIFATKMPWTKQRAVPFTECPFWSLVSHKEQYSPYGIGFKKEYLYEKGGGPAFYIRPDLHNAQVNEFSLNKRQSIKGFKKELYRFITPFVPQYAPQNIREMVPGNPVLDFSHEREWRAPKDFIFTDDKIIFITVENISDIDVINKELTSPIPEDRFLVFSMVLRIEELWPTHKL